VVRVGTVESTQSVAFALAEAGAPDGTVVVADHQTAGRGRRGRRWLDEPGASFLVSMVLRPQARLAELPRLSYVAAVAAAEALRQVAEVPVRLEWPNDLVVRGRKVGGILLESRVSGGRPLVVVGVGINLHQRTFPPELGPRATSVVLETGRLVDRETLLAAWLEAFARWRRRWETEGFDPVRQRWQALSDTLGRWVAVEGAEGVATALDDAGALVVVTPQGPRRVLAGPLEG
jgi:BirA family biotin operon repressor/biotin-[acetyl-CoA-carboxylase] ligase